MSFLFIGKACPEKIHAMPKYYRGNLNEQVSSERLYVSQWFDGIQKVTLELDALKLGQTDKKRSVFGQELSKVVYLPIKSFNST